MPPHICKSATERLVSSQVPVFEAYRGLKIYFLVVLDFVPAENEIAREIMSFLQFMFSLASKAELLGLLLSVHPSAGWVDALRYLLQCLGCRVWWLE